MSFHDKPDKVISHFTKNHIWHNNHKIANLHCLDFGLKLSEIGKNICPPANKRNQIICIKRGYLISTFHYCAWAKWVWWPGSRVVDICRQRRVCLTGTGFGSLFPVLLWLALILPIRFLPSSSHLTLWALNSSFILLDRFFVSLAHQ